MRTLIKEANETMNKETTMVCLNLERSEEPERDGMKPKRIEGYFEK